MSAMRILDANINRAAEGMRVLEDIARFELDRKDWCAKIKQFRHELRGQTPSLLHRDTKGDVGTQVSTQQERSRNSVIDIARASSNRCSEALRVVEEFLKLHNVENSVESIRYKLYDISAAIILALESKDKRQRKLCFVMTKEACVLPWEQTLQEVIGAGCDCVQIREKNMCTAALVRHSKKVVEIANESQVQVIVNDRVDVMLASGAHGVHLGSRDLPIRDARTQCGFGFVIGATAHTVAQIQETIALGADYVGIGAAFASPTKPDVEVAPLNVIKSAFGHNHFVIGGITPENVKTLYAAGCKGVAVSSSIARSTTPAEVVEHLLGCGVPVP
ncbi:MAG: thiamine phosphate synthase [Phycisphaerales bacterium]|nr:thiamine phosphate synthase [Phycisphaerales bacterium]